MHVPKQQALNLACSQGIRNNVFGGLHPCLFKKLVDICRHIIHIFCKYTIISCYTFGEILFICLVSIILHFVTFGKVYCLQCNSFFWIVWYVIAPHPLMILVLLQWKASFIKAHFSCSSIGVKSALVLFLQCLQSVFCCSSSVFIEKTSDVESRIRTVSFC